MVPTYVALGVLIVASFVWCLWMIRRSRPLRGRTQVAWPSADLVKRRAPSGAAVAPAPATVARDYRITYQQRIYINIPFQLAVRFTLPGGLTKPGPKDESRDGHFEIITDDPSLTVKVELLFAEGSFEADRTSAEAALAKGDDTTLSFWLKPLKSEDCLLTVRIYHVREAPTEESVEQIQVTIADVGHGRTQASTTIIKKPAGVKTVETELDRAPLNIEVTSVLGLNARGLDLMLKSLGMLIALFLIALAYITGRQVDLIQSVELVILAIATPFGVKIADPAKGLLKPAKAEDDKVEDAKTKDAKAEK